MTPDAVVTEWLPAAGRRHWMPPLGGLALAALDYIGAFATVTVLFSGASGARARAAYDSIAGTIAAISRPGWSSCRSGTAWCAAGTSARTCRGRGAGWCPWEPWRSL